jgi:hypothetical protein
VANIVTVDGVVVRRVISVGIQGPPGATFVTAVPPITFDPVTDTVGFDGSLSDLNDVDTAGVATDDLLAFDGTEFVPTSEPTVDGLVFDLTAGLEATTEGELVWDDDAGTIDLGMNDGVIQKIGEDQFYRVQADETIARGDLCMAVGTVGNSGVVLVAKARPVYDGNPMDSQRLMGLAAGAIPQGERGYVLSFGQLRKINTLKTGWLEGTILWADPSVPGGLTPTRPAAPAWKTIVALVVTRSAQVGALQVRPTFGSSLANDELVEFNGITAGDLLRYDGTVFRPVRITADME